MHAICSFGENMYVCVIMNVTEADWAYHIVSYRIATS
jgi:hypothetical protein